MREIVSPADLGFFSTLAGSGSLSAAAREMGISAAAVSKRLTAMESRAGVSLISRTTRRMTLTPEGEIYLEHARRILDEIDALSEILGTGKTAPTGLLRVNATLGFGRSFVAPALSKFAMLYPQIDVQLQVSIMPPPLTDDGFDVCIRFGQPPDSRVIARKIARNERLLCASPGYIARHGMPKTPGELVHHNCIVIRQGDEAYGVWRLTAHKKSPKPTESVRLRSRMRTNDGEIAVGWALAGHGILMRAEWDIAAHLASGELVRILPGYSTPNSDIYAVYAHRNQTSTRVRTFVDFFANELAELGRSSGFST